MNNADKIMDATLTGTMLAWCPQCSRAVQREDFAVQAGMCNACLNDSYAEAAEFQAASTVGSPHTPAW